MIARRARGVPDDPRRRRAGHRGDHHESWDEVLPHLPHGDRAEVAELRHAYRVPREIAAALPLLDTIALGIERPLAYRVGASEPPLRQCPRTHLLREAYHEAARLAREEGIVALIVPDELVEPALAHENAFDSIPLLTPREAKGLEFDHVIVVEPALVAEREQGLRELYVALTRPTTTLVVLYASASSLQPRRVLRNARALDTGTAGPLTTRRADPPPDRRRGRARVEQAMVEVELDGRCWSRFARPSRVTASSRSSCTPPKMGIPRS